MILIGLVSCFDNDIDITNKSQNLRHYEPFKGKSLFYDTIPSDVTIDPNSDVMVSSLIDQAQNQGFLIAIKEWYIPVYYVDSTTSRTDVKLTASWAPKSYLTDVPIPEFAEPDPESDGHLVVIDDLNSSIYDFWEMRYRRGKWKAGWGNALPLDGDGVFP